MPRIREYTSSVNAGGTLNTQASAADFGAAVGQGISDVGQGMYALDQRQKQEAEKLKQEQDRTDIADANAKVSAFQLEMANHLRESQDTAAPGASGFSNGYLSTYDERSKGVLDSITNPRARQQAQAHIDSFKTQTGARAFDFERDQQTAFRVNKTVEAVGNSSKLVNSDDTQYGSQVEQTYASIDEAGLAPDKRDKLKNDAKRALAISTMEGLKARNPIGLAQKLLPDLVTSAYAPESTAPTATAPTVNMSILEPKQAERLSRVKLDATHTSAIEAASGGDAAKAQFLTAVVTIENRGKNAPDSNAVSPAGAKGAFQFMPGTAQGYGLANPTDFAASAQAASKYYDDLKRRYNGNVMAMMAEYNGGVKAAQAVLAGGQPTAQETRDYLKMAQALGVGSETAQAPVLRDTQGQVIPQIKVPKDAALQPPQGVDIPAWNDLSLDDQQKFMAGLISDFNSKVAVDRSVMNDDRKNMHANFLAGNKYDSEVQLQAKYAAVYGPEVAQRMVKEDMNAKATGMFTKGIRGKSMEEIGGMLGPAPGSNSTQDDYETRARMEAAVKADREELRKTPNEYVDRYSTVVQGAAREVAAAQAELQKRNTPDALDRVATATQKYITSSLAEQRRLGVPNPQILSEPQEKALVAKIESTLASGQDVAANIDMLYKQYGSYGPTVAAQLAPKVGGLVNVLGSGIDQQSATLLVEAHRNKDELKKTLGDKTKDLDVTVGAAMREFSASLAGIPNGTSVQANYQEQIGTLAMARMSKLGESQTEAVKKAYESLVSNKYNMQDGYRVPKEVDAKVVKEATRLQLLNLGPNDVALMTSSALGNPKDRMDAQLASIRTNAKWVTTAQKDAEGKSVEGLTLMLPTAGGWTAVAAANGQPLFRSFGELVLDYQSRGITTSQDALQRGNMREYERLRTQERAAQRKAEDQRVRDMGVDFRNQPK